jgi:hypothetical protein
MGLYATTLAILANEKGASDAPETIADFSQARTRLQQMIEELPPKQRNQFDQWIKTRAGSSEVYDRFKKWLPYQVR